MSERDPTDIPLDPKRWSMAAEFASSRGELATDVLGTVRDAESLAGLIAHYDFGEPDWNGMLIMLASILLREPPKDVVIETWEQLTLIDEDYGRRFHHGDVRVAGSFLANENIWITGNLHVEGVLEAGFLDSFPDLLVGGDVRTKAATLGGLTSVGGDFDVERFVMLEGQGMLVVQGDLNAPLLLSDGPPEEVPLGAVAQVVDLAEMKAPFHSLAERLGIQPASGDQRAFELIQRALEDVE